MRISLDHQALRFRADFIATELPPGDEELLLWVEAVDIGRTRFAFQRFLICQKCDLCPTQIANTFAQHQFAVVVYTGLNEIVIELIGHAGGTALELFEIGIGPPVTQAAEEIELCSLVVKAMRNFMADDHPDCAIVHGIDRFHVESRRLQNSCGKYYFV